jgi:hypothetical protein
MVPAGTRSRASRVQNEPIEAIRASTPTQFGQDLVLQRELVVSITTRIRVALSVFVVAAGLSASVVPQAAHAAGLMPRKPDVAVSTVGHSGNISNDHLDVAFNLTDKYYDASVQLLSQCNYRKLNDQAAPPRTQQKLASMTLYASTQVPVPYLVTCVPLTGEWVSAVSLTANVVNGDSNTSNNVASWDPFTGK